MSVVGVIQARLSSTRLPGKVLLPLSGEPVLHHVVVRLRAAKRVSQVVVATSVEASDDPIADACVRWRVPCVRGPLDDVLMRFVLTIRETGATTVIRIPADKPFVDPAIVDKVAAEHLAARADYTSNMGPGWPDDAVLPIGLEVEVASSTALLRANESAATAADREHVMPYLYRGDHDFERLYVPTDNPFAPLMPRLTLDTHEDYEVIATLYEALATPGSIIPVERIRSFLEQHPDLIARNARVEQRARPQ
jgi:spore coat polysaccharide biosynthesis protein SpsF